MNARTLIWPAIAALIALALLLAESARSDGHVADEARSSVCVRPGDVPLNDTGDDTPGLKDEVRRALQRNLDRLPLATQRRVLLDGARRQ